MIIDCSGSLPTEEFFLADVQAMRGSRYLHIFGPGCARWVGMAPEECADLLARDPDRFVARILELARANKRDRVEALLEAVDDADITMSVLHNFHEYAALKPGETVIPNDRIAEICTHYPGRFLGFAGVDPTQGAAKAGEEARRAIEDLGLKGIGLRPFRHGIRADDPAYYPIYDIAQMLGVPVWVHCSVNYDARASLEFARPVHLDKVAGDFPNLKLIAGHGGWPYALEMVASAMRHPNLVIDVSAVCHLHMPKPGSGWEPILHFGNNVLQDQIVIGLDWLQLGYAPAQLISEIKALPLKPPVLQKWLGGNAARLFNLAP